MLLLSDFGIRISFGPSPASALGFLLTVLSAGRESWTDRDPLPLAPPTVAGKKRTKSAFPGNGFGATMPGNDIMSMNSTNSPGSLNRRRFLARTGLGLAATQFLSVPLWGANAPGNRLNIAGIGIGSRGGSDVDAMAREGQNIVALCDMDSQYAAKKFQQYPKAKRFTDYRVMFDRLGKEIDAVVIGTPDHSHAVIAMEAMRRGKHVYCEKPMTHSVHEVRHLRAAAHKYGVVTQLGNQGHSYGDNRRLCEWVWSDAIGPVREVHAGCGAFRQVYCQIRNLPKIKQHYDVPASLDYDLWIGPVPFRPYTPFWVHWNWRGWMPFGTGCIGDWFCHVAIRRSGRWTSTPP